MRGALIAGNWKMNGDLNSVRRLLDGLLAGVSAVPGGVELAVFPPSIYLPETAARLADSGVCWGAQNLSEHDSGAYTGELSGQMLRDFGCLYTLVGHSERRTLYGETDADVAAKFAAARRAALQPVLCVGETLAQREQRQTEKVVASQLDAVLSRDGVDALAGAVIAYEPVWAIGTGKTASPQQAQQVHAFIRSQVSAHDATIAASLRILYGGSMKSANAAELLRQTDIDGGLIGGASLDAKEFLAIAQSVS